MADFINLDGRNAWQGALNGLLSAANNANNDDTRKAASQDLNAFRIECPFSDMRTQALEALNNLSLNAVGHILNQVHSVQELLLDNQRFLQGANTAGAQQPFMQARRALALLRDENHPALVNAIETLDEALKSASN
jgi:hypothetical protein